MNHKTHDVTQSEKTGTRTHPFKPKNQSDPSRKDCVTTSSIIRAMNELYLTKIVAEIALAAR